MDGTRHRIEVSILPKPDQYSGWGWRKSIPLFAHSPSPSALAEGWVAVPREPTEEMREALETEQCNFRRSLDKSAWEVFRWNPDGDPDVIQTFETMGSAEDFAEMVDFDLRYAAMLSALPPVAGEAGK